MGTLELDPSAVDPVPAARDGVRERPRLFDNVLSAIGWTPLVRLARLFPDAGFQLYGKLEGLNPGGSLKDRPALAIIEEELRCGRIDSDTVIIESSSGNMGVGLAQVCRYHGLRFICVVDPKAAERNLEVLRAFGAEIETVEEPDPETGEFLQARLHRVEELRTLYPSSFWPNQYTHRLNPRSHYATTMREVVDALGQAPDFLVVATSTCGTVRGCGEFIADHGLHTRIVAVDSVGSRIFDDRRAERHIPGLGAGIRPAHLDADMVWEVVLLTDAECVHGCRRLLDREAILAGGSSGAVVSAVGRIRDRIPEGSTCVLILPDRGERYLDTIYSRAWVARITGSVEGDEDESARQGAAQAPGSMST